MRATIRDVAERAGVSIKTVSRVINNEPAVKDKTRKKVQSVISALNYQPNLSARNLASAASHEIGFVYDNPNAYYVIEMQHGMLKECRKQGYELIIHPSDSKASNIADELVATINRSKLAGMVLTPPLSEMPEVIFAIKLANVPFVRIVSGSEAPDKLSPCVYIDDHKAAFDVTSHLLELGHKNIAFIAGEKEHKSTLERLNGYKDALAEFGIAVNNDFIISGKYSFESGVEGVRELLALSEQPTAVFGCNDEIAAGALFSARLSGMNVPEDLAIAGFEGSPFSEQTWPNLTTAVQPTKKIAALAASILLSNIKNKDLSESFSSERFVPDLLVRGSTDKSMR